MSFLEKALDAGKPVPGFPALALTSLDVKDAPILWIGAMPLHLLDATDAGFFMASPIKSQQKLELRKSESQKARKPGP